MKVSSIDCRRLRKIIRKECGSCLIVDCRPYFSFTNSNIKGSVNANLNSVVVRRSRGGPVPLQFVIPDEKALFRLREGSISAIVALDDRTPHWQKLKKDSVAQIVINSLSHLSCGANICFLKGESSGKFNCFVCLRKCLNNSWLDRKKVAIKIQPRGFTKLCCVCVCKRWKSNVTLALYSFSLLWPRIILNIPFCPAYFIL